MQKYIARRLSFSAQEIKEVLIQVLSDKDRPYPSPAASDVKFTLSENGADLYWAEDCEENL